MLRLHVIFAVFGRNFKQYFTSVLGYLFIFVFVVVCAMLTFNAVFFADNLANLDQLSKYFPQLLLFLIPAITMSVWADERKQGTDAILFTLPATDLEILLGKFLSVVAVYTVALLFSVTQLIALWQLGTPDFGVIVTTYFGYWLAGIALISICMFASSLTESTTVAFVLGALFCAIPVLLFAWAENFGIIRLMESFSIAHQMRDFTLGQISLPGIVYFFSVTIFMLYLNLVVISRRHWSRGQTATLGSHFAVRIVSLMLAVIGINVLAENSSAIISTRIDLTSERLYTLDQTTIDTIKNAAEKGRPVTIQAFISPNVPRKYVSGRKHLIGLLRQYNRLGGSNIDVRLVDVKPNSREVEEARSLGIEPRASREEVAGRMVEQDVYMGAVITSTLGEVVLPFIDGDTAIEYQITRSLATTTDEEKKIKVGILETDAHFNNLRVDDRVYDWIAPRTMKELEKQYEIISLRADELPDLAAEQTSTGETAAGDAEKSADARSTSEQETDEADERRPDVLLVVDPSSLTSAGMSNLVSYIEAGNPTLILADPLPFYWFTYQAPRQLGIVNAPRQPRIGPQAPWSPIATSPMPKESRATTLLNALHIQWQFDRIVWSLFNPHVGFKPKLPDRFQDRWPDHYGDKDNLFVFARSHGGHLAFNPDNVISAGLRELLFFYPGSLAPAPNSKTDFKPLVILKPESAGHFDWDEFTQDVVSTRQEINRMTGMPQTVTGPEENFYTGQNLRVLKPNPRVAYAVDPDDVSDASDQGDSPAREKGPSASGQSEPLTTSLNLQEKRTKLDPWSHVLAAHITGKDNSKINVVFVADTDFVTDMLFEQRDALNVSLDNFTFLVNALETLAGDTSFVRLRNRRETPRTLTKLETMTDSFRQNAALQQEEIEMQINKQLAQAQEELDKQTQEIQGDQELSVMQKIQQSVFSADVAERKFRIKKEKLDQQLETEIDRIRAEEQQNIDAVVGTVWLLSIVLAGIPALVLGTVVLGVRMYNERLHIDPQRRA